MEPKEEESEGVASCRSRDQQVVPTSRCSLRLRKKAEKQEVKPESNDRKRAAAAAATTEELRGQEEHDLEVESHHQDDDQSENDNDSKQKTSSALTPSRRSKRNRNAIRLKGTAVIFYRRLHDLFFCKNKYEYLSSKRMQLKRVCANPPIYVIDNFLTRAELEYFEKKIATCPFEKSFVDNMDFEKNKKDNDNKDGKKRQRRTIMDTTHRTSTFFGFRKLHDSRISALERRIAELLGCWVHQIEALQLVRYLPGQFFGVHHDMGDLLADDDVSLPKKQLGVKRRLVTLFCYLNTLEKDQGGCTHFPAVNLRVKPKKGRAVLWSNITPEGLPEPRTIHAGESVQAAPGKEVVKYGLNIWICEE